MKRVKQNLKEITDNLIAIDVSWKDDVSDRIIEQIGYLEKQLQKGLQFDRNLIKTLLDKDFKSYMTIFRLFLELSKDELTSRLKQVSPDGTGVTKFKKKTDIFLDFFIHNGLINIVQTYKKKQWSWKDIITERLKSGRGSAIKGQRRGRYVEDEVEKIIKRVFGKQYDKGCNFMGSHNQTAKAEFAIPNKESAAIIFEAKAYGATGSKMTDVIGDIEKIIKAKKSYMEFLFVTDGITWLERLSDLKKIVKFQNDGDVRKIYTLSMLNDLEKDLLTLKSDHGL